MTIGSRRRPWFAAAAALVAVIATVSACGSSGGKSSGGSSSGGEIVVGALGPYQGTTAGTYGGLPQVLSAWASTVNASGGIGGHQVKVITVDTSQSSTAGPTAAHKLIDQDHVVAIIDNVDATDATWAGYAASKGVPVLDGTEDSDSLVDPNHFNPFTSGVGGALAVADVARSHGGKIGIAYCAERPTCGQAIQLFKAFQSLLGVTVTSASAVSSSTADFTAVCQQFKQTGATSIFYQGVAPSQATRMLDTCRQQGVTAVPVLYGQGAAPQWKTDPVYRSSDVIDYVAPYFDTDIPGVQAYRAALQKYAPKMIGTSQDNSYGLAAWGSAQLFAAALAQHSGPVTAASVKQGLYALKGETLNGIIAPVTFTEGKATNVNCYFTWTIDGSGQFAATAGGKPSCVPASRADPILQAVLKATKGSGQ